jgi:hypothetical protein
MEKCARVSTPMTTNCRLDKEDDDLEVDQTMQRSVIGNLIYLIDSRPDIMQVFGLIGRFQSNPKETHFLAVKRIFKYLQGTSDYGPWYPKTIELALIAYTNAEWACSIDDRKITSGGAFFLGIFLVSWINKKKSYISLSIAEEKYIAATSCCMQVLWIKTNIKDIQVPGD